MSNKFAFDYDYELPDQYILTNQNVDKRIQVKTNIFNQRNIPTSESDMFSPLHCYNDEEFDVVLFNMTNILGTDVLLYDRATLESVVRSAITKYSQIKSKNRIIELIFDTVDDFIDLLITR